MVGVGLAPTPRCCGIRAGFGLRVAGVAGVAGCGLQGL
ncbi:MAG: hypothetical protein ACJAZ9_001880, partial [Neolewinella sp.]